MTLSDSNIKEELRKGNLKIENYYPLYIGPCSVDLHLYHIAKIFKAPKGEIIDVKNPQLQYYKEFDFSKKGYLKIYPGEFYLLSTIEKLTFPDDICGFIQGRSSVARIGLNVHNAGFFDSGFSGTATLEVTNLTNRAIKIYPEMRICQMVFLKLKNKSDIPYSLKKDRKYFNQQEPEISKLDRDFNE